jgi:hypothetical protein
VSQATLVSSVPDVAPTSVTVMVALSDPYAARRLLTHVEISSSGDASTVTVEPARRSPPVAETLKVALVPAGPILQSVTTEGGESSPRDAWVVDRVPQPMEQ